MSDTIELPQEFEDWKLMPARSFPTFWSELGTIKFDGREWTMGRSEQTAAVYLFTDIPHPEDEKRKATFSMDLRAPFRRLCEQIT